MSEFLTYRSFFDAQQFKELVDLLTENNIPFELENNSAMEDMSIYVGANPNSQDFRVKVRGEDFKKVDKLYEAHVAPIIDQLPADYHVYSYTKDELLEVIRKKDEWSVYDYVLARKLLKEQGVEFNDEALQMIEDNRIEHLSEEKNGKTYVYAGYLFVIFGGLIAFVIGWILHYQKRTLPNGTSVFAFDKNSREHGKIILWLSGARVFIEIIVAFVLFM